MDVIPLHAPAADPSAVRRPLAADLCGQLQAEIEAMLRHAFWTGLQVPADLMDAVEQAGFAHAPDTGGLSIPPVSLTMLAALHSKLAALVSPAMPGTLQLLRAESCKSSKLHGVLGPLRNLRLLTIASFGCMAGFVLLSLSPAVNREAMASDIYTMHGLPLLTVLCFLLSSAGLGSTFHALFTAHGFIASATYDPRYDTSYWIRIGLGLVAGLLLAVLVPMQGGDAPTLAKPLLALLGGFSAALVYRILRRLVDTVESLFHGPAAPTRTPGPGG